MERILITGSNRGIGLEFVRQYLDKGEAQIFAACRQPETANQLNELVIQHPDRLVVVKMEVSDAVSIAESLNTVQAYADGIDLLINNAGINPPHQSFAEITPETMMHVFHVNSVSPLMVVKTYLNLLKHGTNTRVVNISSQLGSLTLRQGGGSYYAYSPSKAALNMLTRFLAADLRTFGITTVTVHPGWVQTDMGGQSASLTPQESVHGLIRLIEDLSPEHNGQFYQWDGRPLPW